MTEQEIKADLINRGVRLRQFHPDGRPMIWYYARGGEYIIVPVEDMDLTIHSIIENHPHLSAQQKQILDLNFAYAISEIPNPENPEEYIPYLDLTMREFTVLYNGNIGQKYINRATEEFYYHAIEIPVMFPHKGEDDMIKMFGLGYGIEKANGIDIEGIITNNVIINPKYMYSKGFADHGKVIKPVTV